MKIWELSYPYPPHYDFAEAGFCGTWSGGELCPECTGASVQRIQPLVIEWERGSDVIGDFSWPRFSFDIAVTERVALALHERFRGFELGPVEMFQHPKLKRPKRPARAKPRVWLPYEGPPLYDLWVTHWVGVDLDHERSTVFLERKCSTCGKTRYVLSGAEKWDSHWDKERGDIIYMHIPRSRGEGLFVRRAELGDADIFRIREFPGPIYCTDRVKDFIEASGFTNVDFLEVGDVVP